MIETPEERNIKAVEQYFKESQDPNYIIEYDYYYDVSDTQAGKEDFISINCLLERNDTAVFKLHTYHWFEVLIHNILKLVGIRSSIFNCDEELEAYKQWNK